MAPNWLLTKRPERMARFVRDQIGHALPNLWLGASVESAETAYRIAHVRNTPATTRFISFEPLLAPVGEVDLTGMDFVYVGGESGRAARPMKEAWIEEIFTQCRKHGAGFCFHQWGSIGPDGIRRNRRDNGKIYKGWVWHEVPSRAYAGASKGAKLWALRKTTSQKASTLKKSAKEPAEKPLRLS